MAAPGQLMDVLSEALDLPRATVFGHDRLLAAAGFRSTSGRGRSTAQVNTRDAAYLLVGIMGSGQVKDTVATVRRYAKTVPQMLMPSPKAFLNLAIPELHRSGSFLDSVASLIEAVGWGSIADYMTRESRSHGGTPAQHVPMIEVAALMPGTVGDIRLTGFKGKTASVRFAVPTPWDKAGRHHAPSDRELRAWEAKVRRLKGSGDFERYGRVTERTILRLAQLLAEDREPPT